MPSQSQFVASRVSPLHDPLLSALLSTLLFRESRPVRGRPPRRPVQSGWLGRLGLPEVLRLPARFAVADSVSVPALSCLSPLCQPSPGPGARLAVRGVVNSGAPMMSSLSDLMGPPDWMSSPTRSVLMAPCAWPRSLPSAAVGRQRPPTAKLCGCAASGSSCFRIDPRGIILFS